LSSDAVSRFVIDLEIFSCLIFSFQFISVILLPEAKKHFTMSQVHR